jgi:dimethylaniline monooxygenase (N-oxide forming)
MRPRFLVIGAGPSGLVAAKVLLEHEFRNEKVDVVIVEEGSKIGGTFVNKTYEGSCLVSSKYISCFSDFREGQETEDHPTICHYVDYLEVCYIHCIYYDMKNKRVIEHNWK